MRTPSPRKLMFLTVCIGGGSLVLFAYFLIFGEAYRRYQHSVPMLIPHPRLPRHRA